MDFFAPNLAVDWCISVVAPAVSAEAAVRAATYARRALARPLVLEDLFPTLFPSSQHAFAGSPWFGDKTPPGWLFWLKQFSKAGGKELAQPFGKDLYGTSARAVAKAVAVSIGTWVAGAREIPNSAEIYKLLGFSPEAVSHFQKDLPAAFAATLVKRVTTKLQGVEIDHLFGKPGQTPAVTAGVVQLEAHTVADQLTKANRKELAAAISKSKGALPK